MTTASKTWPSQLPQKPLLEGYSEGYEDNAIRSPVDKGASKTRPRFTRLRKTRSCVFHLTDSQKSVFDDFYASINGGALPFNIPEPMTGASVVALLREPVSGPSRVGPNAWRISIKFEILP